MTEEEIRQIIHQELEDFLKSDKFVFSKLIQILDGRNIQTGRGTGTQIGTDVDQKVAFYGEVPVVQAGAIADPSGGLTQDQEARNAIIDALTALRNIGIIST